MYVYIYICILLYIYICTPCRIQIFLQHRNSVIQAVLQLGPWSPCPPFLPTSRLPNQWRGKTLNNLKDIACFLNSFNFFHFLNSKLFVCSVPLSCFQWIRKVWDLEPTLCNIAEVKPVPVKEVFRGAFNLKDEETWISHWMFQAVSAVFKRQEFWGAAHSIHASRKDRWKN